MSEIKTNFIRQIIEEDLRTNKHSEVVTRFPPEPNGYLHVGHAKSICLNFGLAQDYKGRCHLRMDDTNPCKEEEEFAHAIEEDVHWLGYQWDSLTHASDYYQAFYDYAIILIEKGLAYVDSSTQEEMRESRGTLQKPGTETPDRSRSVEENLKLFAEMKAGKYKEGEYVLRAKIDMSSGNLNMRDPAMYRIRFATHQRTGSEWCIYPMYDYAHPISDAIEGITHSLCTLEFQDHRPLYDWFINNLPVPAKPIQTEFSRLNLSHTVTSKRKLKDLVDKGIVTGWDDPRMPTIRGMRKRGYPAVAIHQFCELVGISKSDSVIDMNVLEACVREELNRTAKRALCVIDPIKIVLLNYPEDKIEHLTSAFNQQLPELGQRQLPFSREIYIERNDFMENPTPGYYRLSPGKEVRLRHAYIIKADEVIRDAENNITEIRCTVDLDTLGKNPENRKVKGVIHWVSARSAHPITIYEYDRLFTDPNPGQSDDFLQFLNPNSLEEKTGYAEPSLASAIEGEVFQFERLGYYAVNKEVDNKVTAFHSVVSLKESFSPLRTK